MIQLKPTNLIAVEVSEKAEQFSLIKFKEHAVLNYKIKDNKAPLGYQNWSENNGIDGFNSILKSCEILGEVTKEGVQFDVEPYVKKMRFSFSDRYIDYLPYVYSPNNFKTPQESFQSLLQANNVEIPEGKKLLIFLKQ